MAVLSCAKTASRWSALSLFTNTRGITQHAFKTGYNRWASTSTQPALKEDLAEGNAPVDAPVPAQAAHVYSQQPLFSTLADSVSSRTLRAITVNPMKLTHMSPVQAAVLPFLPTLAEPYNPAQDEEGSPASKGERPLRDLLVKARTGTGKTLAFLVPAIEARLKAIEAYGEKALKETGNPDDTALRRRAERVFAQEHVGTLILSPTRELATQIANEAMKLTQHHEGFGVQLLVGGVSKPGQLRSWSRGRLDIVVATPGRMRDMLESEPAVEKAVSKAKMLILDEADTLLDMGFKDEISAIISHLPPTPERQTFLFSATVSREIREIARESLDRNHKFINCVNDNDLPTHASIPQYHTILTSAAQQLPHVLRLIAHDQLSNPGKSKIIVFLPTTKMTKLYSTFFRQLARMCLPAGRGTRLYEIHSKRDQNQRTRTSADFRGDTTGAAVLVTSDVSARGVDYPGVTRVIQVGIPGSTEQYVHRVGRTGRGDNMKGRADLVLLPWESGFVPANLSEMRTKRLTPDELSAALAELAQQFDADPKAFAPANAGHISPSYLRNPRDRDRPRSATLQAPYTPELEKMSDSIASFLQQVDELAVTETMMSLLGYYVGNSQALRTSKMDVVQGVKDWAVQACGLAEPPYISQSMLQRVGVSGDESGRGGYGRSKGRGNDRQNFRPRDSSPSWQGRSQQGSRSRDDGFRDRRQSDWEDRRDQNRDQNRDGGSWAGRGRGRREFEPRSEERGRSGERERFFSTGENRERRSRDRDE